LPTTEGKEELVVEQTQTISGEAAEQEGEGVRLARLATLSPGSPAQLKGRQREGGSKEQPEQEVLAEGEGEEEPE
jgi:hypothetical protein